MFFFQVYTVEPGYNNIGLRDTSSIASAILQYQLLTVTYNILFLS